MFLKFKLIIYHINFRLPFKTQTEIPVFKKELHDITASEHDTVTLEVIVDGDSPYELEWFKNAVEIMENDRISIVKHEDGRFTLNIRECEDDDTGEYCCVAQNEAGRVTCAGWLTVESMLQCLSSCLPF